MQIQNNVSLADYSTMRLGGTAKFLVEVTSEDELIEAYQYADLNKLKVHVVGSGSNTIFGADGFSGLILVNKILGVTKKNEDTSLVLDIGAGEGWDKIVAISVSDGYSDIAALSLIPGTTGAAPVQNIGAYGQQISDCILSVRVLDTKSLEFIELKNADCGFSYRHSRFNTLDKGKYVITSVRMQLNRKSESAPFYADVTRYFEEHSINTNSVSPAQLREAVSTVRVLKLPDPSTIANCGSFFKNPLVTAEKYTTLLAQFPELKAHETDDGELKLYGGQLIELCGLKDYHDEKTGMATWKNQALVLVNEHAQSAVDLEVFKNEITSKVRAKFGITLIQEPEYLDS